MSITVTPHQQTSIAGASPLSLGKFAGDVSLAALKSVRRISKLRVTSYFVLIFTLLLLANASSAQSLFDGSMALTHPDNGYSMPYRLWLPPGIDEPGRSFPLVMWLHGGQGLENEDFLQGLIDATQSPEFASVLVAPQAKRDFWAPCREIGTRNVTCDSNTTRDMSAALQLVDELESQYPIDSSKRLVAGHSFGGVGIFDLFAKHPEVFSAAIPVSSGYMNGGVFGPLEDTRIWAFHGHEDTLLSPFYSRIAIETISQSGNSPIYLEPNGGHGGGFGDDQFLYDIFNDADNELYPWLFDGVEPPLGRMVLRSVGWQCHNRCEQRTGKFDLIIRTGHRWPR